MSYTLDDLEKVRAAKLKVATGELVTSITIGRDTTTFSDGGATLTNLNTLEAEIIGALSPSSMPRRTYAKNGGRG